MKLVLVLISCLTCCLAQTPPVDQSSSSTTTPTAATTAAAPAKLVSAVKWVGAVTASILVSRGESNLNGISLTGQVVRPGLDRTYKFEGLYLYNSVGVPSVAQRVVVQDRRALAFSFNQKMNNVVSFFNRLSVDSNRQQGINYRVMNMVGVTIRDPKKEHRFQLDFSPGAAFVDESKTAFPVENGLHVMPAALQTASLRISKAWTVDQYFLYRVRPSVAHDTHLDAFVGLNGMVFTRRFGMQLGYRYTYEGLVAPGLMRLDTQFTVGIIMKL